jgi:hypothetical protein
MNQTVLALCVVPCLCTTGIFLGFLVVARRFGGGIGGGSLILLLPVLSKVASYVMNRVTGLGGEDDEAVAERRTRSMTDLRAKAQSLDFDPYSGQHSGVAPSMPAPQPPSGFNQQGRLGQQQYDQPGGYGQQNAYNAQGYDNPQSGQAPPVRPGQSQFGAQQAPPPPPGPLPGQFGGMQAGQSRFGQQGGLRGKPVQRPSLGGPQGGQQGGQFGGQQGGQLGGPQGGYNNPPPPGMPSMPSSPGTDFEIPAPSADDIFGPGGLPGLRGQRRHPGRDTRRDRNENDDEVFGGMLDDDGDGYADF